MFYLRQKKMLSNLLIMMFIWLTSSLDYYMIGFLVNTFEDIYLSAMASGISDFLAYGLSAIIYPRLKARMSFFIYFSSSVLGGAIILGYGLKH